MSHHSNSQGLRPKPDLRQAGLARRDALTTEDRDRWSERIADSARSLMVSRLGATGSMVALYASKGSEVGTARLDERLREAGFAVAYPRVVEGDRRLQFHRAARTELVLGGRFGLLEPAPDSAPVGLAEVAAFIVPGLVFDRAGHRIGWGRGHYDATLAAAPETLRIGLAFDCQLVDQVARDPHDIALDIIITEVATYTVA